MIVDGTLGGGGHSEALLQAGATVIGVDRDPVALAAATARLAPFAERFSTRRSNFADAPQTLGEKVDGVLLDLGVSSPQLDEAARGFSFQADGPLDMRMSSDGETAAELIERLAEEELADVIYQYGEERFSRRIAKELKAKLPKTTLELASAVQRAVPKKAWPDKTHVATRTFQGLRIAVNDELGSLDRALSQWPMALKPDGVMAVISFHSLEDRAVKRAFKKLCGEVDDELPRGLPVMPSTVAPEFAPVTKKPIVAGEDELAHNPRSRSAKLRAIRRNP